MITEEPLIVLDTSVLINYAHVDRLDLVAGCYAEARVVEQVQTELQRENQREALDRALDAGIVTPCSVTDPNDIAEAFRIVYEERRGRGESFSFVYARAHGCILAIDDKRAVNLFLRKHPALVTATSKDLMIRAIARKLITVQDADGIKVAWEQECRYKLLFGSFQDHFGQSQN